MTESAGVGVVVDEGGGEGRSDDVEGIGGSGGGGGIDTEVTEDDVEVAVGV